LGQYVKSAALVISLLVSPCFVSQDRKTDSLINLLKTATDSTRVRALNTLFNTFIDSDPSKAFVYAKEALQVSEEIKWKKGIGYAQHAIAHYYHTQGDYAHAIDYWTRSMSTKESLNDKKGVAGCLGNIGNVYLAQGDHITALDYYFKALKIDEERNDKPRIAVQLANIGTVYLNTGDHKKALENYLKALKIDEDLAVAGIADKGPVSTDLGLIGVAYTALGDYTKALEYELRALKISEELQDKNMMAYWYSSIGSVYSKKKEFARAIEYHSKSIQINEEFGNKGLIATTLSNMGSDYTGMAQNALSPGERNRLYTTAESYLIRALKISSEISSLQVTQQIEEALSILYSQTGKDKLALQHFKNHIKLRDSIFSSENIKKTVAAQMNYEFDKKEQAAKFEQEKKDVMATEEKEKQRVITIAVSICLILVLLVAVLILRSLRQNQRKNKIITEQKQAVEEKQKEILDSIYYAKRIQTALITSERYIEKNLGRLKD
jgi:tetratricopeptide (TPR) repeat protein